VLATLALAGWARADVGLLPTVTQGLDTDGSRVSVAVEDVLVELLKERVVKVAPRELPDSPEACLVDATCRGAVMARLGVRELVTVSLDDSAAHDGTIGVAHVVVWTRDGSAFDARTPLRHERDLRGLLTRAVAPSRATGRLDIEGLQPTDVVVIDGLRSEPMVRVAPGPHLVVVLHADGTRTSMSTTVGFEEHQRLDVTSPPQVQVSAPPWGLSWPVIVGGSVAVAGSMGAVIALVAGAGLYDFRARDVAIAAAVTSGAAGVTGLAFASAAFFSVSPLEVTP
jgi:hypothetical protein